MYDPAPLRCPRCQGTGVEPTDPPPLARESTEEPDFLDEIIAERTVESPNWEPSDARTRTDPACSDPACSYRAEIETGYYVRKDEADRLRAALREIAGLNPGHDVSCRETARAALEGSEDE